MKPIIENFLDIDDYKLTMGQLIWLRHKDVSVEFAFKNRGLHIPVARRINLVELKEHIDHLISLTLDPQGYKYLNEMKCGDRPMYQEGYLRFLTKPRSVDYVLERIGDQIKLEFSGPWSGVSFCETQALATISELNTRYILKQLGLSWQQVEKNAEERLLAKIALIKKYPYITIVDFCHRRRALLQWHDQIIDILVHKLGEQFLGTSDTYLAMKHGIPSKGTNAHELPMAYAAMAGEDDKEVRQAPVKVLDDWWSLYGYELSIALSDTFGSKVFLKDMGKQRLAQWKGIRADSMDPIRFGDLVIGSYKKYGIDPRNKLLVFSDGLEVKPIIQYGQHFKGKILTTNGWGTNLGNDLGIKEVIVPIPMVIKLVKANANPAVKLSDNLEKAIGPVKEIRRYIRIFDYHESYQKKCRY